MRAYGIDRRHAWYQTRQEMSPSQRYMVCTAYSIVTLEADGLDDSIRNRSDADFFIFAHCVY